MKNDKILLVSSTSSDYTHFFKKYRIDGHFHWIYLGKDFSTLLNLEKTLSTKGTRIPIGTRLQQTAKEFRRDYIDYIGSLAPKGDALTWWASSVSEKNPFISNVFLYFCYITITREIIASHQGDLVIICENRALMNVLKKNCRPGPDQVIVLDESPCALVKEHARFFMNLIARKSWFVVRYVSRIVISRFFRMAKRLHATSVGSVKTHDCVAIHSWTDQRSFDSHSSYENIYFKDLGTKLLDRNVGFFYLIDVLPTMFYPAAVYRLLWQKEEMYLLEEFLHPFDIFRAILFMKNSPVTDHGIPCFDGIEMSEIIIDEFRTDHFFTRREESYLRYLSVKPITGRFTILSCIYLFENHIWEKLFCAGFQQHSPSASRTGYAHTLVREMYTCYSVSKHEINRMPIPQTIVVSGKHAKKVLTDSGFDAERIIIGGALRYPAILLAQEYSLTSEPSRKKRVLIALSAGFNESLELLTKAVKALEALDVDIIIKCHPILPYKKLFPYVGKLKNNMTVIEKPVDVLLETTDLLLYTETTVCVEALARGIPVIHVKSDCRIDMNIFEGLGSIRSESEISSLKQAVVSALVQNVPVLSEENQAFIRGLFSPMSTEIVDIFLYPHHGAKMGG